MSPYPRPICRRGQSQRSNGSLGPCGSWLPTAAAEGVPSPSAVAEARSRAWPRWPGKEPEHCSFPGRKETGLRTSGSGCWRLSGRASPSPIGKHCCRHQGRAATTKVIVGMAIFAVGRKQMCLFALAVLILNVGPSRPQKCHVFGNAPCSCYGRVIFSPL